MFNTYFQFTGMKSCNFMYDDIKTFVKVKLTLIWFAFTHEFTCK